MPDHDRDHGSFDFWMYLLIVLASVFLVGFLLGILTTRMAMAAMMHAGTQTEVIPNLVAAPVLAAAPAAEALTMTMVFRAVKQDTIHTTAQCGHIRGREVVQMPVCRDCLKRRG